MIDVSQVQLELFLINVLGLFNDTFSAILNVSILRLFVAVLVFLIVVSLLARLIRQGRKGSL